MDDKAKRSRFFEKTSLLANISKDVILRMFFLILTNVKINFIDRKLNLRLYTTIKALLTTNHIELVGKKEFVVATLNLNNETFIVHIVSLTSFNLDIDVHFFCRAQITSLIVDRASITISSK